MRAARARAARIEHAPQLSRAQREQRGASSPHTEEAELRAAERERLVSVSDLARAVAKLDATVRLQMDMTRDDPRDAADAQP